jgi:hypothetical protein
MQFNAAITFDAADEAAAIAEIEAWNMSPGAVLQGLSGVVPVDGLPAAVGDDGALVLAAPPDEA